MSVTAASRNPAPNPTCILVLLDVPPSTEIGLDFCGWVSGPQFRGLSGVPAGVHLLHAASGGSAASGGGGAPRTSTWLHLPPGGVTVLVWDPATEWFGVGEVHRAEATVGAVHRGELNAYLGVYEGGGHAPDQADNEPAPNLLTIAAPYLPLLSSSAVPPGRRSADWARAVSHVTPRGLARLQPGGVAVPLRPDETGVVLSQRSQALAGVGEGTASAGEDAVMAHPGTSTGPWYTPLRGVGPSSLPSDRTAYAQDTTSALEDALRVLAGGLAHAGSPPPGVTLFLGELQTSFLHFAVGQSFSSLEAWKHRADCVLRCEDLVLRAVKGGGGTAPPHQLLPLAWTVLAEQLASLPPDLALEELAPDNFLRRGLTSLVRGLRAAGPANVPPSLAEPARLLLDTAAATFLWDVPGAGELCEAWRLGGEGGGLQQALPTGVYTDMHALLRGLASEAAEEEGDPPVVVDDG